MDDHAGPPGLQPRFKAVAEHGQFAAVLILFLVPQFQRRLHAHGQRDRFRAGPHAFLLMSAEEHGGQRYVMAEHDRADAQRPLELVCRDAQRGDTEGLEIDRDFAGRRDGIGVQRHAVGATDRCQFLDRLDRAGFVVGKHNAHQTRGRLLRRRVEQVREVARLHNAVTIDSHGVESMAAFQKPFGGFQYGSMFDRRNNETAGRLEAEEGQVVRLGSAAGEDEPVRLVAVQVGPQDFGHALAGLFQHAARPLSRLMLAGRVRMAVRVAAGHGLDDLGPSGRSGIVVEINGVHQAIMRPPGSGGNRCAH